MSKDKIPYRFRQRIKEAREKRLEVLDLSNQWRADDSQKSTRILDKVFKLTHLTTLNLRNNQLNNLPESIGNLSSLTRVIAQGNRIKK